jgi:hypothetical protein
MAKDNAQACRDSRAKGAAERERLGIVIRKYPVSKGIDEKLKALCMQHDFTDWRELLDTVIQRLHEATPEDAARFLAVSQHRFEPSKKMLRQIAEFTPAPEPE